MYTCFQINTLLAIHNYCSLKYKRYKLQVDLLQHQDERLPAEQSEEKMMQELN